MYKKKNKFNTFLFYKKSKIKKINQIRTSFTFVSLVAPFLTTKLLFKNQFLTKESKILVKQSYLLLTWFYYLNFCDNVRTEKLQLKFFVLPIKKLIFTSLKAPIAHKNWSKEQFKKKLFKIKINFKAPLSTVVLLNTINKTIFSLLIVKKMFFNFSTNLFFSQFYFFTTHFSDISFFHKLV